jgi:hypothetical protein
MCYDTVAAIMRRLIMANRTEIWRVLQRDGVALASSRGGLFFFARLSPYVLVT